MKVLDTDTLTHLFERHPRVVARYDQETDEIAMAIVSRIEILQGRFAMLLKAADGQELRRAQQRLDRTMESLDEIPNRPQMSLIGCGQTRS
jgi:tRNA(fMet)-specific endonuclease VapC